MNWLVDVFSKAAMLAGVLVAFILILVCAAFLIAGLLDLVGYVRGRK